jgi:type III secretion protein U
MSGDSSGEKTEKPSPKRLQDALKKGEVAKSNELAGSLSFLACIATVMALLTYSTRKIADLHLATERAFEMLNTRTLAALCIETIYLLGSLSFLPALVAAVVYTGALWMQVGTVFSIDPVKPKLDNLNPAKGLKKLFSMKSLVNFLIMLIKLAIVCLAVALVARQILPDAIRVIHADVGGALTVARTALLHLLLWCGGAFVLLGAADFGYQKWQFLKDKRMSMQELKREHKESEGDPHIKAERKRMAGETGPQEQMQYLHLASLIVKDSNERLVVFIYRPKQFKQPLFLLRAAGGAASEEVQAAAKKFQVKVVIDDELTMRLFPIGTTGAMLTPDQGAPILRHLGVRTT